MRKNPHLLHNSHELFSNEDKLHEFIVSLINTENYKDLISICQEVLERNVDSKLIQKVVETLFHHSKYSVIAGIIGAYIKVDLKNDFAFNLVSSLISRSKYKSVEKICKISLEINPNNHFIQKIIFLLIDLQEFNYFTKIFALLLRYNTNINIILDIIDNLINIREYNSLINIGKLIVKYEPFAILRIILLLSDNGKHKEALLLSLEIKKNLPKSPEVWNTIGIVFLNKGLFQKALNSFKYSLELVNSEDPLLKSILWCNIGWINIKLRNYENAISACKKSIKLNQEYSNSYNNLGYTYHMKGNSNKGIELIKKSIDLDENNYHAWYNLSQIYFSLNDIHEAYNCCYKCLSINNQFEKSINFYKELFKFPVFKALGLILSEITALGYRDIISTHDHEMLKITISRRPKDFITYSKKFQELISTLTENNNRNIIAIYGFLPQCPYCKNVFRIRGYSYDHQNKIRTIIYRCSNGHGKERYTSINNKNPFVIKTFVVVKSLAPIPIEFRENFKLINEGISITFRTVETLEINLHKATLLYGSRVMDYSD